jgi:DNA-binding NarL/FixJ family response regulator
MGDERSVTPRARVLVVSGLSLFGEGIEGLLRQEPGLEIVGLETDPGQAIGRIREAHPDVVILTDGQAAAGFAPELVRLVREGFRIRVVEVQLATNTLCLYCGEQQPIREVRDLVDTVQHICDGLTREAHLPLSPAMGKPAT